LLLLIAISDFAPFNSLSKKNAMPEEGVNLRRGALAPLPEVVLPP